MIMGDGIFHLYFDNEKTKLSVKCVHPFDSYSCVDMNKNLPANFVWDIETP